METVPMKEHRRFVKLAQKEIDSLRKKLDNAQLMNERYQQPSMEALELLRRDNELMEEQLSEYRSFHRYYSDNPELNKLCVKWSYLSTEEKYGLMP